MGLRRSWPLLIVTATMFLTLAPGQVTISNIRFVQGTQVESYASNPVSCQPGVQNEYPQNATAGRKITITTTVTSACVSGYNQIIVNILQPNSSLILSTAPATASPAMNTVTAPATRGSWIIIVQVLWNAPPAGGTFEIFQTTITIKII